MHVVFRLGFAKNVSNKRLKSMIYFPGQLNNGYLVNPRHFLHCQHKRWLPNETENKQIHGSGYLRSFIYIKYQIFSIYNDMGNSLELPEVNCL